MLYVIFNQDGEPTKVTDNGRIAGKYENIQYRRNWKSFEDVESIAKSLNTLEGFRKYGAVDKGQYVSPRYDIIELPKVGDDVSYAFNGDAYPRGKIMRITESLRKITTSDGSTFWREKKSGKWIMNGTWSLISGTHNYRNPSF